MAPTDVGERGLDAVRIVVASAAPEWCRVETTTLAEEFERGLRSWVGSLGLALELHGTGFPAPTAVGRHAGPGGDHEFLAAQLEQLERRLADPTVFFVALLVQSSPRTDEKLAAIVRNARLGNPYSRYRIFVDAGHPWAADMVSIPRTDHASVRVLHDLASKPLEWLSGLLFGTITEMVALEASRGAERGAEGLKPSAEMDLPKPDANNDVGGRVESDPPLVGDHNVQFTVYRPRAVRRGVWYPMLAFAHLAERRPEAPADEPDPIEQVRALASQALGDRASAYASPTSDARGGIPKESELTFVPTMEGVEFNPPRRVFSWREDVHEEAFRLRADDSASGPISRGQLTVFLGAFILADVDLVIRLDETAAQPPSPSFQPVVAQHGSGSMRTPALEPAQASPYRKIFPSYSHRDLEIVEQAERLGAAMGDVYLRDRTTLRSGEEWSARLLELIDEADVFQLFWSSNSMRSEYVRQEWEHASKLARRNFIRPTYWEEPMPRSENPLLPPNSLSTLHFHCLAFTGTHAPVAASRAEDGVFPAR